MKAIKSLILPITTFIGVIGSMYLIDSRPQSNLLPLDIRLPQTTTPQSSWTLENPITTNDAGCLAVAIYFEARGDTIESQYAIADVIMYRTMHANFPHTVCEVIKQGVYHPNSTVPIKHKCQFSFHCNGVKEDMYDKRAVGIAEYIANDVLFNLKYQPEVEFALFYHADYVNPEWPYTYSETRGKHLFYF